MSDDCYQPGQHARCPHCSKEVVLLYFENVRTNPSYDFSGLRSMTVDRNAMLQLEFSRCPGCKRSIVRGTLNDKSFFIYPRVPCRRVIHTSTPTFILSDYHEAMLVLQDSPKASAALARRCLQGILTHQGAKKSSLAEQLTEIAPKFPSYIAPFVDHIRKLGNISAHPTQSKSTGEIVDVEPGEAEWMLELLEELFDHFYAKPAEAAERQAALERKYADSSKVRSDPIL